MLAISRADWPASATLWDSTWCSITLVSTNPSTTIGTRLVSATRWVSVRRAEQAPARAQQRHAKCFGRSRAILKRAAPLQTTVRARRVAATPRSRSGGAPAALVRRARPRAARTAALSVSMS